MIEVKRNNDRYTIEVNDTFIVIAREELLILEDCMHECLETDMNVRYSGPVIPIIDTSDIDDDMEDFDREGAIETLEHMKNGWEE